MDKQLYEGTSDGSDFSGALKNAIREAEKFIGHTADGLLRWRLVEIKGQQGGFAGVNDITVVIEAHGS